MATLFNGSEVPQFNEALKELVQAKGIDVEYDNAIIAKLEEMRVFVDNSASICNSTLLKLMDFSGSNLELDGEYLFVNTLYLKSTEVEIIDTDGSHYVGIVSRSNAESVMLSKYWRLGEYIEIRNHSVVSPSEDYMLTKEKSQLLFMYKDMVQTMVSPLGEVYSSVYDSAISELSAVSSKTAINSFIEKNATLDLNSILVENNGYIIEKGKVTFAELAEMSSTPVSSFVFKTGTVTVQDLRDDYLSKDGLAINNGNIPLNTNLISNYDAVSEMDKKFVKSSNHEFSIHIKRDGDISESRLIAIASDIMTNSIDVSEYTRQPLTHKEVSFIVDRIINEIKNSIGDC